MPPALHCPPGKFAAYWVSCALFLLAARAQAGGVLGETGDEITTSRYSIDLNQGALWAGSRVTSLGGAYVAIPYDVDGMLQNPAAPAVRPFFSVTDFDYWLGLGVTFPSDLDGMDFFNSGSTIDGTSSPESLIYITPAAILQFGALGVGVTLELQNYGLGSIDVEGEPPRDLTMVFNQAHIQVAYAFGRGELVLGGGLRLLQIETRVGERFSRDVPLSGSGMGAEIGGLWKPRNQYFSVGMAYRSAILAPARLISGTYPNEEGDVVLSSSRGDFYLPEAAQLPWDLNVGVAYNLGYAKPNSPWRSDVSESRRAVLELELQAVLIEEQRDSDLTHARTEEEAREIEEAADIALERIADRIDVAIDDGYWKMQKELAEQSRHVGMVSVSLVMTGKATDAVGVESFLTQTVNRSGESVVFSPRIGSEVEPIPDWLKLRAGSYLEPTRFESGSPRAHYTGGLDIPLGVWNVFGLWPDDYRWRAGLGVDIARDFQTTSISIAGWYPRHRGPIPASLRAN